MARPTGVTSGERKDGRTPAPAADAAGAATRFRRMPPYSAFAGIYDAAMGEAMLPAIIDEFETSRRRFKAGTGAIADIGCGTGRFLKFLARFGGRLWGVDASPAMLRRAARLLAGTGARLLRMDMRALRLPEKVDTITCTFDTINYLLTAGDLRRSIAGFAAALKPGGILMLDYIPEGSACGPARLCQRVRVENTRSIWCAALDPAGRGSRVVLHIECPDRAGGALYFSEIHTQKWHSESDMLFALEDGGFRLLQHRRVVSQHGGDWLHCVARLKA